MQRMLVRLEMFLSRAGSRKWIVRCVWKQIKSRNKRFQQILGLLLGYVSIDANTQAFKALVDPTYAYLDWSRLRWSH